MSNYLVSPYFNRVKSISTYVLKVDGRVKVANSYKNTLDNVKVGILDTLVRVLRELKVLVSHEDIVFIEIQNAHLCKWLNGIVEYKEYAEYLDRVFEVLETLDCRYRFIFTNSPIAKNYQGAFSKTEGNSVADAFKDLV